jgi:hypothetical protein
MGQPLGIYNNMPFDTGNLFARIITFASCAIRILDALGISDAETRFDAAPLSESDRANLILLTIDLVLTNELDDHLAAQVA